MDTSTILSQRVMPWANEKLGSSKFYIHAYGSVITCLAEILGTTPDIINGTLNAVNGYGPDAQGEIDQVIWEKIVPAFGGWSAQFFAPYNNDIILSALQAGRGVIVQTANSPLGDPNVLHAVRYIGDGKCHDPFTGTERPTSDFPDVKSFIVLTKTPDAPLEPSVPAAQPDPTATLAMETQENKPVDPSVPTPPSGNIAVTLANLPIHEKNAIVAHLESATVEIKKLLGL